MFFLDIIKMEIKYLKKLKDYKGNRTFAREGISVEEIEEIETEFNNGMRLPSSFREYLFLAGKRNATALDNGNGLKWMQSFGKETLDLYEVNIERPFFVISQWDNCMMFTFIYLDENSENPKVYLCYVDYIEDGEEFIRVIDDKGFSNFIEDHITVAISDSKHLKFDKE